MDGLNYCCVGCGISVTLDYEALGRMVKRRLKQLAPVVKEYPGGQSE